MPDDTDNSNEEIVASLRESLRKSEDEVRRLRRLNQQHIHKWAKICRDIIRQCVATHMEKAAFAMLQNYIDEYVESTQQGEQDS